MAQGQKGPDKRKYGANNVSITMDGTDIVIRVDATVQLHAAGTPNAQGKERKRNLVATTSGFSTVGSCQVSLNVTS